MRPLLRMAVLFSAAVFAGCAQPDSSAAWRVEEMEIPLYHSSTIDSESGAMLHIEYCGAKLTRGSETIQIVYRPIDFAARNPGFAEGDRVTVDGLDGQGGVEDFGGADGPDYWIYDVKVTKVGS